MLHPDPSLVVICQRGCETSRGPLVVGEMVRLPLDEALQLSSRDVVTLGSWQEQQLEDPKPARGRYRRADLQADAS